MKFLIALSAMIGAALLYLLSSASANTELFSHNYATLLALTGGLALSLVALISYQLWQLRKAIREQVFGAKLTLRLTLFFTVIAILPGMVVYMVSVQFLSKSIESWFDVRVERALEGGLNLGRNSLSSELKSLGKKGQFIGLILASQPAYKHGATLARLIDRNEEQEATLFNLQGQQLVYVRGHADRRSPQPDAEILRQAQKTGLVSLVDSLHDNSLILRVLVPVRMDTGELEVLQFVQPLPKGLAEDAESVQSVYRDYQELSLSRVGLKRLYGITLTLSLLIVLLSAVSAAFYLSERLSAPLAALAEGTRAVARGDFSGNYPVQSKDELGALTGLFNQMIARLSTAKTLEEQHQREVENAKAYLESILTHLSSGVMVVDEQFRLRSVNASAGHILGAALQTLAGQSLIEIGERHALLRPFTESILAAFADSNNREWQRQLERISKNGVQMLLLRGTRLNMPTESGYVIVFDDITHLLQAERQAAWGEVARRLAHEIKNPLTPIQLSAERLQHKLSDKLGAQEALMLRRATQTIVSQVAAMKNMVTEFADYAKAPAPKLAPLDMHQLLLEVMGLYEGNSSPITLCLDAKHTLINGDATRLRQVVHNLLQNAHDALQHSLTPRIVLLTEDDESELRMTVQDNGTGFPQHVLARGFEPYMTTKAKGTGLGLAIVKKIVEEHGGNIRIENVPNGGARVVVSFPLVRETEVA